MRISRYLPKSYPLANYFNTNILSTIHDAMQNRGINLKEKDQNLIWEGILINLKSKISFNVLSISFVVYSVLIWLIELLYWGDHIESEICHSLLFFVVTDLTCYDLSYIVFMWPRYRRMWSPQSAHLASANESTSEVWMKHLSDRRLMEDFVKKYSRTTIRGSEISLDIIEEPLNILDSCRNFQNRNRRYSSQQMNRYYRVRLSNILSTVTKEQLMIWLKIPLQFSQRIKFSDEQSLNQFIVVYVNNQASEKLL